MSGTGMSSNTRGLPYSCKRAAFISNLLLSRGGFTIQVIGGPCLVIERKAGVCSWHVAPPQYGPELYRASTRVARLVWSWRKSSQQYRYSFLRRRLWARQPLRQRQLLHSRGGCAWHIAFVARSS